MPGYGIVGPAEGRGLLPWSWTAERLVGSRDYWLATVTPKGRPHVMPVWGVWHERSAWFSASFRSRKTRNLEVTPHAVITTDNALQPVVVDGDVEKIDAPPHLEEFTGLVNSKIRHRLPAAVLHGERMLSVASEMGLQPRRGGLRRHPDALGLRRRPVSRSCRRGRARRALTP